MQEAYLSRIMYDLPYLSGESMARNMDKVRLGLSREIYCPIGLDRDTKEDLLKLYEVDNIDDAIDKIMKIEGIESAINSINSNGIKAKLIYKYNEVLNNHMFYVKLNK